MRATALLVVTVLVVLGAWGVIRGGSRSHAIAAGAALVVVGGPLLVIARRQLGDAFAVMPEAKGLVTRGVYARLPHPMYVFLDAALLGVVLLVGQAWLLLIWGVLVGMQMWQARREARVLEQAYGSAYREYRRRTWW